MSQPGAEGIATVIGEGRKMSRQGHLRHPGGKGSPTAGVLRRWALAPCLRGPRQGVLGDG